MPDAPILSGTPRALRPEELSRLVESEASRTHGCVLLDARGEHSPPVDHLPGSAWVPWPDEGGPPPTFLMPARGRPLIAVGLAGEVERRARQLRSGGWPTWWADLPRSGLELEAGPPTGALWDVDPMIRRWRDRLPHPRRGRTIELGSGSSREGVALAQWGHDVLAVDRLADALALARRRAEHHGVRIATLQRNLRAPSDLPGGPFDLGVCLRLAAGAWVEGLRGQLAPGALLLWRSYGALDDSKLVPESHPKGPRRVSQRVAPRRLSALLGEGWEPLDGPRIELTAGSTWTVAALLRTTE